MEWLNTGQVSHDSAGQMIQVSSIFTYASWDHFAHGLFSLLTGKKICGHLYAKKMTTIPVWLEVRRSQKGWGTAGKAETRLVRAFRVLPRTWKVMLRYPWELYLKVSCAAWKVAWMVVGVRPKLEPNFSDTVLTMGDILKWFHFFLIQR